MDSYFKLRWVADQVAKRWCSGCRELTCDARCACGVCERSWSWIAGADGAPCDVDVDADGAEGEDDACAEPVVEDAWPDAGTRRNDMRR